jgi:hypothetical protein
MGRERKFGIESFLSKVAKPIGGQYYFYQYIKNQNQDFVVPDLVLTEEIIPLIESVKRIISNKDYNKFRKMIYGGKLSKKDIDYYSKFSGRKKGFPRERRLIIC